MSAARPSPIARKTISNPQPGEREAEQERGRPEGLELARLGCADQVGPHPAEAVDGAKAASVLRGRKRPPRPALMLRITIVRGDADRDR